MAPNVKYPIDVKKILECVYSTENTERLKCDYDRYEMYNGQIKHHVQAAITKEFLLPETVRNMIHRIVPLNLIKKVTNKLAKIYLKEPIRVAISDDEVGDQESMDAYVKLLGFNEVMKTANRYVELFKHVLIEPFLWRGLPWARALPSHQYTPYNKDETVKCIPTAIVKHIQMAGIEKSKHLHHIWSDEEFIVVSGEGAIVSRDVNPYGVLPFTYINTSQENVLPLSDDDLIAMQYCICLLLTDLNFASKYQSWSMIYVIGKLGKNISFNPNSVIELTASPGSETQPSIGTVDPQVKSDELLRLIESLIGLLLTTKSLSVGTVSTSLDPAQAASGVAKILDQAEVIDEQEDQKTLMLTAEQDFWEKLANQILPIWKTSELDPLYYFPFSPNFAMTVVYTQREAYKSEDMVIDTEIKKIDGGLTTREMSLKKIYPNLDDNQIQELNKKIMLDMQVQMKEFSNGIQGQNGGQSKQASPFANQGNQGSAGNNSNTPA